MMFKKTNEDQFLKTFKISSRVYLIILLILVSFLGGMFLGTYRFNQLTPQDFFKEVFEEGLLSSSKGVDPDLLEEVWQIIKERYIDQPVDRKEMFYGAVAGLVASLEDPYSVFMTPKETEFFNEEISGSFEGIGAELAIKEEKLTIVAPLANSPAKEAGLKTNDLILAIDGFDTQGISLEKAVSLIRGKRGTKVVLEILSEDEEESKEVEIVRGVIKISSVKWEMKENNIGYLQIIHFTSETESNFNAAVQNILVSEPKGLILDLRGNPGGYLETAIDIASEFIEKGTIVIEEFGSGERKEYQAEGRALLKELKTVVLIDRGSASASEILAGALQDHGKAVILGEETFGKGLVQDFREFSDGSSLKLTVARWYTPSGRSIDEEGITPDIEVELTQEDYEAGRDPQLERAMEMF